MAWVGGAVSILCLVYIAVERYFAIIHPLRQRGRFTRRRLKIFIVAGWIVAILINIPDLIRAKYYQPDSHLCVNDGNITYGYIATKVNSLVWMVLAGIVPLSIMVYLYSIVVHRLWFKPVENLEASQKAALRYRKGVTITLIAVSVIFAISWIPNMTAYVMEYWGEVEITWFDKTATVLLTFNSCVNPVLYSMRMKRFREHLRDMLLCKESQIIRVEVAVLSPGEAAVCVRPTAGHATDKSEESAHNMHQSPVLQHSQEMVTTKLAFNVTKSRRESVVKANIGIIEGSSTAITENKEVIANVEVPRVVYWKI
ncbi:hypothetical protein OS493_013132 [Desmophyllum pertusum]|uniref:G-protein coupled receptors family 1 profile domain-containing protein n=1 Tax=Desmophyllum pertusum TaxID=174260 RepID=A0A9W9YT43_9CNID|nr:hypothetical protein OS493_013132 [Desmophyllum pertusum]